METHTILLSFLGASIQEAIHWFDLKQTLGDNVVISKSKDYWIITIVTIVLFSLATPFIVGSFGTSEDWVYIVVAFAFPEIIRKLAKIILDKQQVGLTPKTLAQTISKITLKYSSHERRLFIEYWGQFL